MNERKLLYHKRLFEEIIWKMFSFLKFNFFKWKSFLEAFLNCVCKMPDYLGGDQRKTKDDGVKEDNIKGEFFLKLFSFKLYLAFFSSFYSSTRRSWDWTS